MKPLITIGCKTDHCGIVVEADTSFLVEGKAVHVEGMRHVCPKCKKTVSAISSGKGFLTVNSKTIIMAGDKASCGATFLPQQSIAVRTNGSGSGSGSSQGSPAPIFPSITQDDMIMGFSKVPKQSLTEEDKILTSEECRLIMFRFTYNQHRKTKHIKNISNLPEIPLNIRKSVTKLYFDVEDMEEGMGAIEVLFDGLTGLMGKTVGMKEIFKTLAGDQVKLLAENKFKILWNNDSRNKYFKVGSYDNPVDKFNNCNFHLINSALLKNSDLVEIFRPYAL